MKLDNEGLAKIKQLREDCETAAEFYREKPGLVSPETTIDLYRTIYRLAGIIENFQK